MAAVKLYYPKRLTDYISSFEYYHFPVKREATPIYTLFPLGTVQLLFQFDTIVAHKTAFTSGWQLRPNVFIAGPYCKAYEMKLPPGSKILSVNFNVTRFSYFTNLSTSTLRNRLLHPANIWGAATRDWIEQIALSISIERQLLLIENFLITQLRNRKASSINQAVTEIYQHNGTGKVHDYARRANLSIAQYRKKFTDEVGLAPKAFQRLVRLNKVSHYYKQHPASSLTESAYQFGYFDQSHFIKDFKSLTGFAPHTYLQNKRFLQF